MGVGMKSLLVKETMSSVIRYRKCDHTRTVQANMRVDVYRNLNRHDQFSIRPKSGEFKGKVAGYAPCVVLADAILVTSMAGHLRVKRSTHRDVHAYLRGTLIDVFDSQMHMQPSVDALRVSYNPHTDHRFYTLKRDAEGRLISASLSYIDQAPELLKYAIVSVGDVWFTNDISALYQEEKNIAA